MLWSWILTIVGVSGFWLAGRKVWWAWYINIANQGLWLAYALVTEQYGFLLAIPVYLAVFIPNAVRWTREHRQKITTGAITADSYSQSDIVANSYTEGTIGK